MLKKVLSGLIYITAITSPAVAQEEVEVRYEADKGQGADKSHDVYRGNTLPMKLCALGDPVNFDVWTRSLDSWSDHTLAAGQCMFATPTRISIKPSTGTLSMKILPNIHMGRDETVLRE